MWCSTTTTADVPTPPSGAHAPTIPPTLYADTSSAAATITNIKLFFILTTPLPLVKIYLHAWTRGPGKRLVSPSHSRFLSSGFGLR